MQWNREKNSPRNKHGCTVLFLELYVTTTICVEGFVTILNFLFKLFLSKAQPLIGFWWQKCISAFNRESWPDTVVPPSGLGSGPSVQLWQRKAAEPFLEFCSWKFGAACGNTGFKCWFCLRQRCSQILLKMQTTGVPVGLTAILLELYSFLSKAFFVINPFQCPCSKTHPAPFVIEQSHKVLLDRLWSNWFEPVLC